MPTPNAVDVVLPAGGRISGEFAKAAGTDIKALIRFGDETVLRRTVRVLRESGRVDRIAAIGPIAVRAEALACGVDLALEEGATGPDNIFRGIDALTDPAPHILIVTGDLPFLTPDSVRDFLALCPLESDLCVPIVRREAFETLYPGLIRTDTRLREGFVRLGGIFRVDAETLRRIRPHLERMFAARKSNWQMARLIGPVFIARYLLRQLTVEQIVEHAAGILNCKGVAVQNAPPELAFDIDILEEFEYAGSHHGRVTPRVQKE